MNVQKMIIDHLKNSPLLTPHFRSNQTYTMTGLKAYPDNPIFMSEHGKRVFVNGIFETRGNSIKFALELIPDVTPYVREDWRIEARHKLLPNLTKQDGVYLRLINFNVFLQDVESKEDFTTAMSNIYKEITYMIQTGHPSHKWKFQNNRVKDWTKIFAHFPKRHPTILN